jgi:hypothetical protein
MDLLPAASGNVNAAKGAGGRLKTGQAVWMLCAKAE